MTSEQPAKVFPHHILRGSVDDVIEQTVELLMEPAKDLLHFRQEILPGYFPEGEPEVTSKMWDAMYGVHLAESPFSAQESNAFAQAFSMHPAQWIALSGMSDWLDFQKSRIASDLGCSTLLFADHPSIAGMQTWDLHKAVEGKSVVLERHIDGLLSSLTLTTAMGHAHFGVNEKGVCVGTNNLQCLNTQIGVVFSAAIQQCLDTANDAIEAVTTLSSLTLMSGHNFIVADPSGDVFNVERTTYNIAVTPVFHTLAHTNHYLSHALAPQGHVYSSTSHPRCDYLQTVQQASNHPTIEQSQEWFSDHTIPVCRHGEADDSIVTCALLAFHPNQKSLSIMRGNPCNGVWKTYTLN